MLIAPKKLPDAATSSLALEAIAAVNRFAGGRVERDLRSLAAAGADDVIHLPLLETAAAAAASRIVATGATAATTLASGFRC